MSILCCKHCQGEKDLIPIQSIQNNQKVTEYECFSCLFAQMKATPSLDKNETKRMQAQHMFTFIQPREEGNKE